MSNTTTKIRVGHVLEELAAMPEGSVHAAITSPPYWGLRNYELPDTGWPDGWRGCLGAEPTVLLYVDHLVQVFEALHRVLRDEGTLWVNIGDTYAGSWGNSGSRPELDGKTLNQRPKDADYYARGGWDNYRERPPSSYHQPGGIKSRDLCLIPARLAIAMQEAGWYVRSAIIWAKGVSFSPTHHGAVMPSSMRGWRFEDGKLKKGSWRPTSAHELVYLFAKRPKYYADSEVSREPNAQAYRQGKAQVGRNIRDVWTVATAKFPGAHFATFPPKLIEPMIRAATSERGVCPECGAPWARVVERGVPPASELKPISPYRTLGWRPTCKCDYQDTIPATILDPFAGAGTTMMVARDLGRSSIGIELSKDYAQMAAQRLWGEEALCDVSE